MMQTLRERLNRIRRPEKGGKMTGFLFCLLLGTVLGIFSKWLDDLAFDSTVWWHSVLEMLDLGNFFSDMAIWLLIALVIAVSAENALRAAGKVFLFFAGMCLAYHLYTVNISGFNPFSYMLIWYGITALSPLAAVLCWYAKGEGIAAQILDSGITAVFFLSCFSLGFLYVDLRGILYLITFVCSLCVIYRDRKQMMISLAGGFLLAFLLNPLWPFH